MQSNIIIYSQHSPFNYVKIKAITNVDKVFIEIRDKFSKVIVGLIYRPPEQHLEFGHDLSDSIFALSCRHDVVIIGGEVVRSIKLSFRA